MKELRRKNVGENPSESIPEGMTGLILKSGQASALVVPSNPIKDENSILHWTHEYWRTNVEGSPDGTVRAKRRDLQLFLRFFAEVVRSAQVDYWTPSVSKSFKRWLETDNLRKPVREHQKSYAPTSINRTLATLRHFAGFIAENRRFEAGDPVAGVKDLVVKEPEWNGLSDLELMRLRSALDQVTQLSTRAHQLPLRNRAAFFLAIDTALRAFEIAGLNYDQYDGRYLRDVRCKADVYRDVYVSVEARREIELYMEVERGYATGPFLITNRGGRMSRQQIDRFLRRLVAHANSRLQPGETPIVLHAHKLRHTSTKRVYDKKGPVEARDHGGHRSFKHLACYATQTREEREEMRDGLWR